MLIKNFIIEDKATFFAFGFYCLGFLYLDRLQLHPCTFILLLLSRDVCVIKRRFTKTNLLKAIYIVFFIYKMFLLLVHEHALSAVRDACMREYQQQKRLGFTTSV